VEDRDALEANDAVDEFKSGGEAVSLFDVVACGEQMRGVEAAAPTCRLCSAFSISPNFFQARAERSAHASGVFEQNAQRSCRQIFCRLLD